MESNTVISTRIRLARNIDGLPFPHKLSEVQARQIADRTESALCSVDKFNRYDMSRISPLDGTILREKHLISPDLLSDSPFGSVILSPDETISVMVNEEDHLREQVIMSGLSLDQAFDAVNRIDNILSKSMDFAFSRKLGYLTACATNLGTGMRASVMMFLPALTMQNMIDSCINEVSRLNITVRGVYGEGSKADGYLYQISNQRTLGITERDIISSVRNAINHISDAENRARLVLKRDETALKDKIFRAWGILTNAYTLTTAEAMELLALVRLGASYGYIDIGSAEEYQKLLIHCQPANIQYVGGKNMSASERDIFRARYVAATIERVAHKINV